jgi:hypothetical protein
MQFLGKSLTVATKLATALVLISSPFTMGCGGGYQSLAPTPTADVIPDQPVMPNAAGAGTGRNGLGRGPTPIDLGTAQGFRLLAESAITDIPTSAVTGNVGLSPASGSFIGIPCGEVTGIIYQADAGGAGCMTQDSSGLGTATSDKRTAYTVGNGRAPDYTELGAGNIGGMNLAPATYYWSSALIIPTTLTLTGGPNDVWIFQVAQGFDISTNVKVILAGGAKPENIYWNVFQATINVGAVMKGTINSSTNIAVKTGATVNGRLLANTAITLESNVIAP